MWTTADEEIARLARRQHGVWSRAQALRFMTPKMIWRRVHRGRWIRVDTGVYADAASAPTWERSVMAAVLAEPRAAGSHRTAAVMHRLAGFRPGRPEITVRPTANVRGRLAIVHRGVDVPATVIRQIPVVTIEQTFIDLAPIVSQSRLGAALSDHTSTAPHVLDAVRDRYCDLAPRGGRDLRRLRTVLERFGAGDLPDETELERRLRLALTTSGIPRVQWQAPFPGRLPGRRRVDGLIEAWNLVIEGDGRAWHTRLEDFERDRRRDAEAAAAGFQTLRFTYHQLVHEVGWVRRIVVATGGARAAA